MSEYKLDSYVDGGIKVTMQTKDEKLYLSSVFSRMSERLIKGTNQILTAPSRRSRGFSEEIPSYTDKLIDNHSKDGIKEFEISMINGFRKINRWQE